MRMMCRSSRSSASFPVIKACHEKNGRLAGSQAVERVRERPQRSAQLLHRVFTVAHALRYEGKRIREAT